MQKREKSKGKWIVEKQVVKSGNSKTSKKKIILIVGVIIGFIVLAILAFFIGMNLIEKEDFNDTILNDSVVNDSDQLIPIFNDTDIVNQTNDTIITSSLGGPGSSSRSPGSDPGCSPTLSCANYPGQCGTSLSDGCSNSLNCSGNCNFDEICVSGLCEPDPCYGVVCSDYNETECEINDCLSCMWDGTECVKMVYYVRAGASGDGNNWTNAYATLPNVLERGATYYIADGNYSGYVFDDDEVGEQYIYIKKAVDDVRCSGAEKTPMGCHGPATDWQDEWGDEQAVFRDDIDPGSHGLNSFSIGFTYTSYYIFNGQIEDGFKLEKEGIRGSPMHLYQSDHIIIRNCDIDGSFETAVEGVSLSHVSGGCWGAFVSGVSNITIENCKIHDAADDGIQIYDGNYVNIIGNEIYNLYGDDSGSPCCPADSDGIEIFKVNNSNFIGNLIYNSKNNAAFSFGHNPDEYCHNIIMANNVFYSPESDFVIYIRHVHGIKVYNNVFWGRENNGTGGICIGNVSVTDMDMYNNIMTSIVNYGVGYDPAEHRMDYNTIGVDLGAYSLQPHDIVTMNPGFVNMSFINGDIPYTSNPRFVEAEYFALKNNSIAINNGTDGVALSLDIPIRDYFGNLRDGMPDIGAYEYVGLEIPTLSPFTKLWNWIKNLFV